MLPPRLTCRAPPLRHSFLQSGFFSRVAQKRAHGFSQTRKWHTARRQEFLLYHFNGNACAHIGLSYAPGMNRPARWVLPPGMLVRSKMTKPSA